MKLFFSELRKLMSSRLIALLFAVLIAVNFALAMRSTSVAKSTATVRRMFDDYAENREEYDAYCDELEAIIMESVRDEPILPHTYDTEGNLDDYGILRSLRERLEYFDTFEPTINKLIRQTELRIEELHSFGYSDKTYTTGSQIAARDQYRRLLERVRLVPEFTLGYDQYFNYQLVMVFVLLFVTATVSYIFLCDNSVGFRQIMHSTRRGRLGSAAAKLSVSLAVSLAATLAFLGTTLLAVGIRTGGYSSLLSPIQNFSAYITVPDSMTVLEYLLLNCGLRLCAVGVFSIIIALLASARLPYAACFGGGIIVAAVNCLVFYYPYVGTAPNVKYLNLAAMCEVNVLTRMFRTVNFFKIPVRMSLALVIACLLIGILLSAATMLCFCRIRVGRTSPLSRVSALLRKHFKPVRGKEPPKRGRKRTYPLGLAAYEICKMRLPVVVIIVAAMLVGRGIYIDRAIGNLAAYSEAVYYGYIEQLQSLDAEGRQSFIRAEGERINGLLDKAKSNEMSALYISRKITDEEYNEYLTEYYDAMEQKPQLERAQSYLRYIERKSAETGREARIIYSTGYERFFSAAQNVFLLLALVFICYRAFSMEFGIGGGFSQLLLSAKRGRLDTFRVKLLLYLLSSAVIAVMFCAVDVSIAASKFTLSDLDAPLYSVELFGATSGALTIAQYMALSVALSMLSAVVIAVIVLALSLFVKREFATLTLALLAVGVPALATATALPELSELSVLGLTAPLSLVRHSATLNWLSSSAVYAIAACVGWFAVAAVIFMLARKKFAGGNNIK